MRRLVLILLLSSPAWAATYYVDNCVTVGSDSNNGTSTSTPWLTVAKVNAGSFSAGDSVLFQKSCTWRETLTVPTSGSSGNQITFGSYGTGALPVISGANALSSWTAATPAAIPVLSPGSGAYSTTQTGSATCATSGEYMCYTRDSTNPVTNGAGGCTHGTLYSTSFSVTTTETDRVACNASSYTQSLLAYQTLIFPWTPATATASGSKSPTMWFKADSISQSNNTPVTSWADSSGNGHTATQGTVPDQPQFQTSQINSLPAVYCANPSFLTIASPPTLTNATIFVVFSSLYSNNALLGGSATAGGLEYWLSGGAQALSASYGASIGTGNNTGVWADTWLQTAATWANASAYAFYLYNGETIPDGSGSSSVSITQATENICADHGGTNQLFNGSIAEIIVYGSVLNSSDITEVQGYLHGRYGL